MWAESNPVLEAQLVSGPPIVSNAMRRVCFAYLSCILLVRLLDALLCLQLADVLHSNSSAVHSIAISCKSAGCPMLCTSLSADCARKFVQEPSCTA